MFFDSIIIHTIIEFATAFALILIYLSYFIKRRSIRIVTRTFAFALCLPWVTALERTHYFVIGLMLVAAVASSHKLESFRIVFLFIGLLFFIDGLYISKVLYEVSVQPKVDCNAVAFTCQSDTLRRPVQLPSKSNGISVTIRKEVCFQPYFALNRYSIFLTDYDIFKKVYTKYFYGSSDSSYVIEAD